MNKSAVIGIVIVVVLLFGGLLLAKSRKSTAPMIKTEEVGAQPTKAMMKPTGEMNGKGDLVMMVKNSKFGDIVTAANDMSLYVFDKDTANVSNCTGQCATEWPPYLVSGVTPSPMPAHLNTFTRTDGKMQYSWDGKPLYFYLGDKQVGDTNGDGYDNLWHIAK